MLAIPALHQLHRRVVAAFSVQLELEGNRAAKAAARRTNEHEGQVAQFHDAAARAVDPAAVLEELEAAKAALQAKGREAARAAKLAERRIAELEAQIEHLQGGAAKTATPVAQEGEEKRSRRGMSDFLGITSHLGAPGLLEGSLGRSWLTSKPVIEEVLQFLPVTLELITYSLLVAFAIAVPIGMVSAIRPQGVVARASFVWGLFAGSQPEFWWGLMFTFVFFFVFQQVGLPHAPPPLGRLSPMLDKPARITGFIVIDALLHGEMRVAGDAAMHLMLPVATLVFVISGPIVKMVRQNMSRVLTSDYMLYAQLAGLTRWQVGRYALRGALGPSLTLLAFIYGFLIGGAVPLEMIFSLNGLGEYAVRAVLQLDFTAIQGAVLVIALLSLLAYLVIDCLHAIVDPRITL